MGVVSPQVVPRTREEPNVVIKRDCFARKGFGPDIVCPGAGKLNCATCTILPSRHENHYLNMPFDQHLPQHVIVNLRPIRNVKAGGFDDNLVPCLTQSLSRSRQLFAIFLHDLLCERINRRAASSLFNMTEACRQRATEIGDVRASENTISCPNYCLMNFASLCQ